jgi:hypothetical protein
VKLPWTPRTRRLLFLVLVVLVLAFPMVSTMITRARIESSGVDVTATVLDAARKGDSYLVAFRFPKAVDPDQHRYSAEVDKAAYDKAVARKVITVRVLEGRPRAHRVEGEIRDNTSYVVAGVTIVVVLAVGLVWVRFGRRRPPVRLRALEPLQAAGPDEVGTLGRTTGDVFEAVGRVLSADDSEVVLDLGERRVVVALDGHGHELEVGAVARARGSLVG